MKGAAGILGVLVGMFCLGYVGLFGGMLGGAAGWFALFGTPGNDMAGWAQNVKTLSWLGPCLVLLGGVITFGSPLLGSICMGLGATALWRLMGFGPMGNVFIVPAGGAAVLALAAALGEIDPPKHKAGPRSSRLRATPVPEVATPADTRCTWCNHSNPLAARFCGNCGQSLASVPAATRAPLVEKNSARLGSRATTAAASLSKFCASLARKMYAQAFKLMRAAVAWARNVSGRTWLIATGVLSSVLTAVILMLELHVGETPARSPSPFPVTALPSLDCTRAGSWAGEQVCGDAALTAADDMMTSAYRARMDALTTADGRRALRADQRAWLDDRNSCLLANRPHDCLAGLYAQRIAELATP